jgi:dienelactone hydrolase
MVSDPTLTVYPAAVDRAPTPPSSSARAAVTNSCRRSAKGSSTRSDVLRAIRTVRSQAAKYDVASDRIGVMGSSAGGHLAASAATLYDPSNAAGMAWQ